MNRIVLILCVLIAGLSDVQAQDDIWMTRTGEITFFSSTPVEDIEAENESVTVIFKSNTGDLAFKVLMKSFSFERAAMQDHFNHDYLHTDEFPNATFKGSINDYSGIDLTQNGKYEVDVIGDLNMHGVVNQCKHSGTVEVKDGKVLLHSKFMLHIPDYNVKVPANFVKNISKDVEVTVHATLEPYVR